MDAQLDLIRPGHVRLGPQGPEVFGQAASVLQAFGTIAAVESGSPRQRREYQQERLAAILDAARAHSPFWACRIPRGRPDLARLPVLTRPQLRTQVEAEGALPVGPEHNGVGSNATSGATAEPLRFFVTGLNGAYNMARYAFDDVVGQRDLSLPITVMHKSFESPRRFDHWPAMTGEIWRTGPGLGLPVTGVTVEGLLDALGGSDLGHFVTRPPFLAGFLEHLATTGRRPGRVGEMLTLGETVPPELRERARDVLGARIADRYSCEEVGPIAFQCPALDTHYHVASSNVIVETVDERGRVVEDGRIGHVVLSGLNAVATPVLRYDVGDMARLLPRCPCGHGGPALTELRGRRKSLLRTPDGRRQFFRIDSGAMRAIAPVRSCRLVQTGTADLVLQIEAARPIARDERARLAETVAAKVSPLFTVRVEQVAAIDWGPSGKRSEVVNLLDDPIGRDP